MTSLLKSLNLAMRLTGDPVDWAEGAFAEVVASNRFNFVTCDMTFSKISSEDIADRIGMSVRFRVAKRYRQGWNVDLVASDAERGAIAIYTTDGGYEVNSSESFLPIDEGLRNVLHPCLMGRIHVAPYDGEPEPSDEDRAIFELARDAYLGHVAACPACRKEQSGKAGHN